MIDNEIAKIFAKYENKTDNCINFIRYEGEKEFWIDKEIDNFFKENNIVGLVGLTEAYDKSNFCVRVLSIAYVENNKLKLCTKKLMMF